MENLLREYLERGFSESGERNHSVPGPVVTISREFGCPSKLIAQLLTDTLNKRNVNTLSRKWRFINKEVVEAAAHQLELHPSEVSHLLSSGGKGVVEDIMASFSQSYVSNHRMRKTITGIVRTIAEQGNLIIVGRGGVVILQDRPDTIHIRLQAPADWRIQKIRKSKNVSEKEARKIMEEIDNKRSALMDLLSGGKPPPCLFDLTLNCSKLSVEEIAGTIIGLMEIIKMI